MEFNIYISPNCYKSFVRFQHEILLEVHQAILETKNPLIVKTLLKINPSHLYKDLEFHIELFKSFLALNDIKLLQNYIYWRYRVYYYRGIDPKYIELEHHIWREIFGQYIDTHHIIPLESIYSFLINNHDLFLEEALNNIFRLENDIFRDLFENLKEPYSQKAIEICKPYCDTLENFCDFFSHTIHPISKYIGYQWEINQLSVAKEHITTSNIEAIINYFLPRYSKKEPNNLSVLVTGVKDEFHTIGMKISIEILNLLGYKTIYLGSHTPNNDILNTLLEFKCDFIVIANSLQTNLSTVLTLVKEIKLQDFERESKIIIGGNAFSFLSDPLRQIDCDYYFKNHKQFFDFFNFEQINYNTSDKK